MCHMKNLFKIRLGSERWHRAIILFTAIFIFAVIIQFAFRWYERGTEARNRLRAAAEDISKRIDYAERWELARLWRTDIIAGSYCVADNDGLIINIQGFIPVMGFRVSLNKLSPGMRTVIVPETGETWRILVKPLIGGTVILGISPPQEVTNVDERLRANAELFGSSLEDALIIQNEQVDMYMEYAIVDDSQKLRYAIGAIPLRILQKPIYPSKGGEVIDEAGLNYGIFSQAIRDKQARTVGTIYTLEKLDPQPWLVLRTWIVNCLSSAALAFFGTLIGIPYIGEKFDPRRLLNKALQTGESQTVEFKESLRWDNWQVLQPNGEKPKKNPTEVKSISEGITVKTMSAFLNGRGGTLLIGVADDKSIVGLERDYESLVKSGEPRGNRDKDRDRFQLRVRRLLSERIPNISKHHIETNILEVDGKDICIVNAWLASEPTYLAEGKLTFFYIRDGASSKSLDVAATVAYVEQRWPRSIWRRFANMFRTS
jgi:hypothetical protein